MSATVMAATGRAEEADGRRSATFLVWGMVGGALLVGLWLRLVGLSYQPYDNHGFRQTQTLFTIETFYAQGIDLLHPKTLYTGYPGTFVLELPLFQALGAVLYHIFGPHLAAIRVLNILLGLASMWLLYRITALLLERTTAVLAALIYWLAPLNVFYQRSMLLDPMAVFFGLLSFYGLALVLELPSAPGSRPSTRRRRLQFGVFAAATWTTAMIKTLYLWP